MVNEVCWKGISILIKNSIILSQTCCSIIADERSFNPVPFINVKVKTSRMTGKNSVIDELLLTDVSQVCKTLDRVFQVAFLPSSFVETEVGMLYRLQKLRNIFLFKI